MDFLDKDMQILEDMIVKEKLKKKSKESRLILEIYDIIEKMAENIDGISASQQYLNRELESMDQSISDVLGTIYNIE